MKPSAIVVMIFAFIGLVYSAIMFSVVFPYLFRKSLSLLRKIKNKIKNKMKNKLKKETCQDCACWQRDNEFIDCVNNGTNKALHIAMVKNIIQFGWPEIDIDCPGKQKRKGK